MISQLLTGSYASEEDFRGTKSIEPAPKAKVPQIFAKTTHVLISVYLEVLNTKTISI
jgi:hypothetical protein